MALGIYKQSNPDTKFSQNGSFTNPIGLTFDGIRGGTLVKKFYVRNNDSSFWYKDIEVTPVTKDGADIISGSGGFDWKLIAGDSEPLEEQWKLVSPANTISLSNLGSVGSPDTSTYLPFWLRVTVPPSISVQVLEGTRLDITAEESLV